VLTNTGSSPAEASVLPNAYQHDGPRTIRLNPGDTASPRSTSQRAPIGTNFTVTAPVFERALVRRLETVEISEAIPAMAT
jgi:hypothetical protein